MPTRLFNKFWNGFAELSPYKLDNFKFIEAVEFSENFHDFQNVNLGLGHCHYADDSDKEYCLIQKLKDNGSIERRIFSIRELSDTHGELVIGDIAENSKEKDYPLLKIIGKKCQFFCFNWHNCGYKLFFMVQ